MNRKIVERKNNIEFNIVKDSSVTLIKNIFHIRILKGKIMIPKTIHYIWLGENKPNDHVKKCMQSWRVLQESGWNIKKWDDHSLQQLNPPKVVTAALENKKYAFAADWLRLYVLYLEGGVYLDTDVEIIKKFDDLLTEDTAMLLGYIFDASLGTAVIGAEPGNQVIGALLKQYETAEYQYKPETRDFKIKFEFMPEMFMVNNNDMFTAYFLKNVKGFALTGKKCRCGDDGKIHIYPKEYFEGYSMHFKNNYSIHHCFGSWRYFENENEKHDESILRNYLKNIYFLRWAKDKYIRMKKKNLPFQNYFVRR